MSKRFSTFQIALFLFLHLGAPFNSAKAAYEVIRLPISDQLPQRSVERLHIDAVRHLWIRTQAGYHRFDGNKLEDLYAFERSGLSERRYINLSRHLIPAPNNAIWLIDSDRGLSRYDVTAKAFSTVVEDDDGIFADSRTATSFLYDSRQRLWITFNDREVVSIDSQLHSDFHPALSMHLQKGDHISAMAETTDGSLIFASNYGVLMDCSIHGTNCVSSYLPEKIAGTGPLRPLWITAGKDNVFYISTFSKGAFIYDRNSESLKKLTLSANGEPEPRFGSAPPFYTTEDGGVWIATMGGLYYTSESQQAFRLHTENSSFLTNVMNTVIGIGNERYLVGTVEGIYLVRKTFFENFSEASGLRSSLMTNFAAYSKDSILLATFQGLDLLDLTTNEFSPAEEVLPGLSLIDPRVMAVYQNADITWLGFFKHGLYKYDASSSKTFPVINSLHPIEGVSDVTKITDQIIAVATIDSGIHLVDTNSGSIFRVPIDIEQGSPPGKQTFFTVKPLDNGDIVAASTNGVVLIRFSGTDPSSMNFTNSRHLEGTDVYSIIQSASGDVWAGTYEQGLHVWRKSKSVDDPVFLRFETSPKLSSNTIYAIEEDSLGMLWLSTNNGLIRLNPATGHISTFDKTDGLISNEFDHNASFVDTHGRLYFGGHEGFSRFDPSKFTSKRTPPPLRFTGISISKNSVAYDPAYFKDLNLTLDYNDYAVDFEFSTMDVITPGRSQFKYMLEGFNKGWVDNGYKNTATFTNLPPGTYIFRVIGANSEGVWNYDGISIPLKVLPAPWRTWWALSLYLIAAFFLMNFAKRYYDARLLRSEALRQKGVMTNTAIRAMDELQDQLDQQHRLVRNLRKHAAHTIDIISESLEIEGGELYGVKAKKSIYRSKQRLACLKALESSVYFHGDTLKVNLRDSVDSMFTKIMDSSPRQKCEIVLANQIRDDLIPIDVATPIVILLHELILNSINHAFDNLESIECLEVGLRAKSGPKHWILTFSDSGIGLSADIDPNRPATRGMRLISAAVNCLDGHLEVDRTRGTAFKIFIPQPKNA